VPSFDAIAATLTIDFTVQNIQQQYNGGDPLFDLLGLSPDPTSLTGRIVVQESPYSTGSIGGGDVARYTYDSFYVDIGGIVIHASSSDATDDNNAYVQNGFAGNLFGTSDIFDIRSFDDQEIFAGDYKFDYMRILSQDSNSILSSTAIPTISELNALNADTLPDYFRIEYTNPDTGYFSRLQGDVVYSEPVVVPIPPAYWLFGSGLLGLAGIARRKKAA
jgi:hypothetical protein